MSKISLTMVTMKANTCTTATYYQTLHPTSSPAEGMSQSKSTLNNLAQRMASINARNVLKNSRRVTSSSMSLNLPFGLWNILTTHLRADISDSKDTSRLTSAFIAGVVSVLGKREISKAITSPNSPRKPRSNTACIVHSLDASTQKREAKFASGRTTWPDTSVPSMRIASKFHKPFVPKLQVPSCTFVSQVHVVKSDPVAARED
jgi:hypothetical protein